MHLRTRSQKGSFIGSLELPPVKELQSHQLKGWVVCVQLFKWCESAQAFSLSTAPLGQENSKLASCTCGEFHRFRDIFIFHMQVIDVDLSWPFMTSAIDTGENRSTVTCEGLG